MQSVFVVWESISFWFIAWYLRLLSYIFHTEIAHFPASVWFVFTLQCSWAAEISSMKSFVMPSSNQKHFQFVFHTNRCPFSCEDSSLSDHLPMFVRITLLSFPNVFLWALYRMDVCSTSSGIGNHSIWRARSDFSIATWCLVAPTSVMCCTAGLGWRDALHVQKSTFDKLNKHAACIMFEQSFTSCSSSLLSLSYHAFVSV